MNLDVHGGVYLCHYNHYREGAEHEQPPSRAHVVLSFP